MLRAFSAAGPARFLRDLARDLPDVKAAAEKHTARHYHDLSWPRMLMRVLETPMRGVLLNMSRKHLERSGGLWSSVLSREFLAQSMGFRRPAHIQMPPRRNRNTVKNIVNHLNVTASVLSAHRSWHSWTVILLDAHGTMLRSIRAAVPCPRGLGLWARCEQRDAKLTGMLPASHLTDVLVAMLPADAAQALAAAVPAAQAGGNAGHQFRSVREGCESCTLQSPS